MNLNVNGDMLYCQIFRSVTLWLACVQSFPFIWLKTTRYNYQKLEIIHQRDQYLFSMEFCSNAGNAALTELASLLTSL